MGFAMLGGMEYITTAMIMRFTTILSTSTCFEVITNSYHLSKRSGTFPIRQLKAGVDCRQNSSEGMGLVEERGGWVQVTGWYRQRRAG
jgi:hypothetical protein